MYTTDVTPSQPNPAGSSEQSSLPVASAQGPEAADGSKRHLLAPAVSRSSSKVDKQSTLDNTQETANDESGNPLRGSKRSILRGRRDRSRGSSRRSRRTNHDSPNMENDKPATNPEAPDTAKPEKKKVSYRLFAFLSCCSSSNEDAEDTAIPAKKTAKRQSLSNRQSTPEKTGPAPGDSSTGDSQEPNYYREEKPNPTVTSNQSPSQVDEDQNAQPQEQGSKFGGISSLPGQTGTDNDRTVAQKDHDAAQSQTDATQDSSAANTLPVSAPESEKHEGSTQKPEEAVAPVQAGEDITADPQAMAKPLAETDPKEEAKYYSHDEDAAGLPTELPPPPPIAPPGQESSQQWLLPPAQPPLQKRKCLVLDLDETLVHSSFKVCNIHFIASKISF